MIFLKYSSSNCTCQNLSPIRLLVYKLHLSEATVANFQYNENFVDKALFSDEKNTLQAKQWLDKCYSDAAPSETTVKRWYADFKCSLIDTNNAECSGCPNLAVVLENTKKTPHTCFARS